MNFDPGFALGVRAVNLHRDPLPHGLPSWFPGRVVAGLTVLTVMLCGLLIAAVDQPVAIYLRQFAETDVIAVFRTVTHVGHSAIWYGLAAGGFAGTLFLGHRMQVDVERWTWRRRARSFLFMAMSMLASGTLVNALKLGFGRYRPRFLFDDGTAGFAPFALTLDDCAFPSGHTQSIVAAATALAILFPRLTVLMTVLAVLVAASRFLTTVHFVSDVIAGAYVGLATALVMRRYFERTGIPLAWSAPNPGIALSSLR